MKRLIVSLMLFVTSFVTIALDNDNIEKQITTLESLRWKDREDLTSLLNQIVPNLGQASLQQRLRVNLVRAEQFALDGDYSKSERIVSAIAQVERHPQQQIRAYTLLAQLANLRGQYEEAFVLLGKGEALIETVPASIEKLYLLTAAVDLFSKARVYDEAELRAFQALELAHSINDKSAMCSASFAIAKLNYAQQQFEKAQLLFSNQVELCRENGDVLYVGVGEVGLGRTLLRNGNVLAAEKSLLQGLQTLTGTRFQAGILRAHIALAELKMEEKEYQFAMNEIVVAIRLGIQLGQWKELTDAYRFAAEASERLGDLDDALSYERLLHDATETALSSSREIRLAYLKVRFNSTAEKQKISLFKKENEINKLREDAVLKHRWLVVLGLFAVVAICGLLFVLLIRSRKEHKHYRVLSQIDALTGIYNRRHSHELAEIRYRECQEANEPFSVVMADVDYFKQINDTFGHAVGDDVLKLIASQFKKAMRKRDIVGRTGGEEFSFFLPGSNEEQAKPIVSRCRENMLAIKEMVAQEIGVTVSFGIASCVDGQTPLETLIRRADEALYAAKAAGRNRVVVYQGKSDESKSDSQLEVML
ncbi:GGDEF domain-containing protein [Echinimonas agarilytica]|uniref:diguanylate cyclase n=1 Tax=Echinimonas agarilytica TaxID=1215918 RepID=A0AA41W7E0_9GAMM|nr:GGDEF domain-containing protein [Echinimonas agarilytica]MCM2679843.1 GGDEF domain-containing protein [Echinimonas agarilytica]